MKKEIWKPIPNYEKYYQVSNFGNVKSLNREVYDERGYFKKLKGKPLKFSVNGNKGLSTYYRVTLKRNSKEKTSHREYIHRLVAMLFIPNPDNKPEVNHKDGNKFNNKVANLEWCDGLHNKRHAIRIGLIDKCKKVINTETNEIYLSIQDAAKYTDYCWQHLSKMMRGVFKNKTKMEFY